MNRKFTTILSALAISLNVFAQQPNIDFSYFDNPLWVPSGILYENNPDFLFVPGSNSPLLFNGSDTSSVSNRGKFLFMYDYFYHARFNTNLTHLQYIPDSLSSRAKSTNNRNPVQIGLMDFSYQAFSDAAFNEALIIWDSIDFEARFVDSIFSIDTLWTIDTTVTPHDTLGIDTIVETTIHFHPDSLAQIAIETHQLFMASTFNFNVIIKDGDPLEFSLSAINLFRENTSQDPYQLSIDGGATFHNIIVNDPQHLSFASHNLETGRHELILRRGMHAESPISKFELDLVVTYADFNYTVSEFDSDKCPDLDFSDGVGSGMASFIISGQNNQKLKKPLIIQGRRIKKKHVCF